MGLSKIGAARHATLLVCLVMIGVASGAVDTLIDESKRSEDEDIRVSDGHHAVNALSTEAVQDKCNEDQIMYYLAEIQVINPETILQIVSYKDVTTVCRKVEDTLGSIDAWMLDCNPPPATNMYMQLTAGLKILEDELCTNSNYQPDFEENLPCYQQLHDEYIDCMGPADWIADMDGQELCDQYKVIADCYYTQTARLCGVKAAETLKELVVEIMNMVVQNDCPEVKRNPVVIDSMTEHDVYARTSSSGSIKSYSILYTLLLLTNRMFLAHRN